MNAVANANLVGITGIARRLVLDGALSDVDARHAMEAATAAKVPLPQHLLQARLVTAAQLAAANAIEFGMPLLDASVMDQTQAPLKLVSIDLLQKHNVLPLYKRGGRLFVAVSDPTNFAALDEIKFNTNLAVEPVLVDGDTIRRLMDNWLDDSDRLAELL